MSLRRDWEKRSLSDADKSQLHKTSDALFYALVIGFVAGVMLVVSFSSPYWLDSWEDTQSPFQNMGLWEFCFFRFRHPDYQFDHVFNGCYPLYGEEYRLIREKLLPGWLIVVQLFVTLALILSYVGQAIMVALFLRYPLEIIIRFEYHFSIVASICHGIASVFLLIAIIIFASCCWARDWLLYPNHNFLSWSYGFCVASGIMHIFVGLLMLKDYKDAKERKEHNKALIMQMQPPGFSSTSTYHMGAGSGYL